MKIRLIGLEKIISGKDGVEIVTRLRELDHTSTDSLENYMKLLVERAQKMAEIVERDQVSLNFDYKNFQPDLSGSLDKQCRNFVAELIKTRLAIIVEP